MYILIQNGNSIINGVAVFYWISSKDTKADGEKERKKAREKPSDPPKLADTKSGRLQKRRKKQRKKGPSGQLHEGMSKKTSETIETNETMRLW